MLMEKRKLTLDDIREAVYSLNNAQLGEDVRRMNDEALLKCRLAEDLGMDSMDVLELILNLENRCNICFPIGIEVEIKHGGDTVQECLNACNNQIF